MVRKRLAEMKQLVVEKTENIISYQEYAAKNAEANITVTKWKDYKWQLNNSIKTVAAFEKFTGITFTEEEHEELENTISKFPLSITPYYASLIKKENYRNDPIFKQAFPNPAELKISKIRHERPPT
jgi:lysine 2,3-aminomutase